jgi:hypothetical protein
LHVLEICCISQTPVRTHVHQEVLRLLSALELGPKTVLIYQIAVRIPKDLDLFDSKRSPTKKMHVCHLVASMNDAKFLIEAPLSTQLIVGRLFLLDYLSKLS